MKWMKSVCKCFLLIIAIGFFTSESLFAQEKEYYPDPDPLVQKKLAEWQDLKFGLLMHWGPYSQRSVVESWSICPEDVGWATGARLQKGGENYFDYLKNYEALKNTFNPTKFNPEKWAEAAKEAGMKYVVFTTKHHDGFCMFDTKYTDYKITDKDCPFSTNPRSNVTKEIFDAFRKDNFWIGAYFSKPDWHSDYYWWQRFPPLDRNVNYSISKHPEQWKKFVDYTHNQINELMTDYGKIDILWLDGGWVRKKTDAEINEEYAQSRKEGIYEFNSQSQDINMPLLAKEAREKQPGLIVVDRAVPGPQQNYLTPEQHIPDTGLPYPWETCMTMGNSWSYVKGDVYKPADELIKKLVDIVSKGGNYLLNIGPGPDGEWDPVAYSRLKEIGAWIKQNGEAIYGTRMYKVFGEGDNIRFTQTKDGKTKFIFLFDFPDKTISLKEMQLDKKSRLQMIGSKKKLSWKQTENGVSISIPANLKSVSEHVWVIKVSE
ncbi:MAG: alpha-L-fucosidase [Ginsengibacter sp.]